MKKNIIFLLLLAELSMSLMTIKPAQVEFFEEDDEIESNDPDIKDIKKEIVDKNHTKFIVSYTLNAPTLIVSKKIIANKPQYELIDKNKNNVIATGQEAEEYFKEIEEVYNDEFAS